SSAPTFANICGVAVERTSEDRFTSEDRRDLVPSVRVLLEGHVRRTRHRCLVLQVRSNAAVVDGESFEVGQNRNGQLRRPGVATQLVCWAHVILDVDGGLLGFHEELAGRGDSETVVGGLRAAPKPE